MICKMIHQKEIICMKSTHLSPKSVSKLQETCRFGNRISLFAEAPCALFSAWIQQPSLEDEASQSFQKHCILHAFFHRIFNDFLHDFQTSQFYKITFLLQTCRKNQGFTCLKSNYNFNVFYT